MPDVRLQEDITIFRKKTASVFVENPFSVCDEDKRLYRTGDMVRMKGDGNIEYIGRIDSQVKIRGYRIELGEIEGALLKHDKVKNAAVIVIEKAETNISQLIILVKSFRKMS